MQRRLFELDLEYVMSIPPNHGDMELYYQVEKYFRDNYKYIYRSGCYSRNTNQSQMRICLDRKADLELAEKEINKILPHIVEDNGTKNIDIFEHTLSEYGVYDLIIDNKYHLRKTTYGCPDIFFTSDSLREVLERIREEYYYE